MKSPLGAPLPHESAWRHVSGEARYVDDLPEPPGLLHVLVLPSPHPRARILRKDATRARQVPGVVAVFFAEDVPGDNQVGHNVPDEPLLARDEVFCVGQAVAVVCAGSREAGRRALALIEVDWEPLPALLTIEEAMAAGSLIGEPHRVRRGHFQAAYDKAPHRLEGTFRSPGQEHFYLETHCALAVPGEDRTMKVYSSTQHPTETQFLVARNLRWPRNRVIVESPRMGGGFGGKETQGAHWANLAAVGAWITGRPVKCWLDRDSDMTMSGHRHPFMTRWAAGFDDEGRVLAWKADLHADAGWAADLSGAILDRSVFHVDNAYWFPNVEINGYAVRTHKVSNTAFRGFGAPQGMIVAEHVMERVASFLGLDPLEVRKRNFYGPAPRNRAPYDQEIKDFRLPRLVPDLEASSDLARRKEEIRAWNAAHPWQKRGIALTPIKFGVSFTISMLNQASAYLVVYTDGTVQMNHGGTEMGQGLHTKMLQVCAHALGVPIEHIRAMPTTTEKIPNTPPTAASSGADLNGQAVRAAARALVERLRPVAAELLGLDEGCVRVCSETTEVPDEAPTPSDGRPPWAWREGIGAVSFAQVCAKAWMKGIQLVATGFYRTPDIAYDRARGRGKPFHYYAFGAAVSEVEVSGLTGEWRLRRVDILHDVGDSLSPDVDRGQIEGGFLQGVGWLGCEELVWDGKGALLTHSPSTYKIPAIGEMPLDFRVRFLDRAHQPDVIYGSKAIGEPPFMLAISAYLAVCHAVSAFGDGSFVTVPAPATPEAVLLAVESARET